MTPPPALAPVSTDFIQASNAEDYDAALPSFVGLGLAAFASPDALAALADRAEAGVSALQLIFDAQAAGAIDLPDRLADQLRLLLDRATGSVRIAQPAGSAHLALVN